MSFNLEGKTFMPVVNAENGEVDDQTRFHYHQQNDLVWAKYDGGRIVRGHLIAKVVAGDKLDMRYHHLNTDGEIMTGTCISEIVYLPDGRMKFKEWWQWLSGDRSSGYSEIVEI